MEVIGLSMARTGIYSTQRMKTETPDAFMRMVEQTFLNALEVAPEDGSLQDLKTRIEILRAAGRLGAADDEMRKWYSKRQV
ncbi:hypothetical protein CCAX7_36140 [Capsulimonas corticalis]|uniref:Uncharacterized protein n=1 Tax=Capsulimonas corticalis TaxID=2219043 RepID=A0A402D6X8_9BACT|nr:hypothetical protein CCAX7_36140 [Capsulimonas corticalis]